MEPTEMPAPADPVLELQVMTAVAAELKRLPDQDAMRRVLQWASDVFGAKVAALNPSHKVAVTATSEAAMLPADTDAIKTKYDSLPDFYSATGPSRETDKALVVGYWVQVVQGVGEFDAFTINKELRHLGYAVANITSAFDNLMNRKPQLVIQTRKSGTSRQARKLYKLTMEGQRAVERMLGGAEE